MTVPASKEPAEPDLLVSSDPNFRPTAVDVGPDGAIYVADWQNPIIGHMQHHIRDPNRDHQHGRIYRLTYEDRPLLKQPPIAGQSVDKLLDLLKEPEDGVRTLAKIELGKHDPAEVITALNHWLTTITADADHQHEMAEALWVHQWMNVVDEDLLDRQLHALDPHARAPPSASSAIGAIAFPMRCHYSKTLSTIPAPASASKRSAPSVSSTIRRPSKSPLKRSIILPTITSITASRKPSASSNQSGANPSWMAPPSPLPITPAWSIS